MVAVVDSSVQGTHGASLVALGWVLWHGGGGGGGAGGYVEAYLHTQHASKDHA